MSIKGGISVIYYEKHWNLEMSIKRKRSWLLSKSLTVVVPQKRSTREQSKLIMLIANRTKGNLISLFLLQREEGRTPPRPADGQNMTAPPSEIFLLWLLLLCSQFSLLWNTSLQTHASISKLQPGFFVFIVSPSWSKWLAATLSHGRRTAETLGLFLWCFCGN